MPSGEVLFITASIKSFVFCWKLTRTPGVGSRLDEVHAGVEGDGGHGAGVVVGHLDGAVPLGGVAVEEQAQRGARQLMQGRDLLQVPGQLEGQVAQQRGGDQHRGARPRPQPRQQPQYYRRPPQERVRHLRTNSCVTSAPSSASTCSHKPHPSFPQPGAPRFLTGFELPYADPACQFAGA